MKRSTFFGSLDQKRHIPTVQGFEMTFLPFLLAGKHTILQGYVDHFLLYKIQLQFQNWYRKFDINNAASLEIVVMVQNVTLRIILLGET